MGTPTKEKHMKARKNMKDLNAIDKQNLDGAYGATAVAMDWPEDLSEKAKKALDYLDDTAYLFHYLGWKENQQEGSLRTVRQGRHGKKD